MKLTPPGLVTEYHEVPSAAEPSKFSSVFHGPPKCAVGSAAYVGRLGKTGPGAIATPLYCAAKGAERRKSGYEKVAPGPRPVMTEYHRCVPWSLL